MQQHPTLAERYANDSIHYAHHSLEQLRRINSQLTWAVIFLAVITVCAVVVAAVAVTVPIYPK